MGLETLLSLASSLDLPHDHLLDDTPEEVADDCFFEAWQPWDAGLHENGWLWLQCPPKSRLAKILLAESVANRNFRHVVSQ